MILCRMVQARLLQYLGNELSPGSVRWLARHLERCSHCAAELERIAATRERAIAALTTTSNPPPDLAGRVLARVSALAPPGRASSRAPGISWRALAAAPVAIVLVAAAFAAGGWWRSRKAPVADPGPVLSLASLESLHASIEPGDAPPPDAGSVGRLAGQLSSSTGCEVVAPAPTQIAASLLCAHCESISGTRIAHFRYRTRAGIVSLFEAPVRSMAGSVMPHGDHHSEAFTVGRRGRVAYVAWCTRQTGCVMMARMPADALLRVAQAAAGPADAGSARQAPP